MTLILVRKTSERFVLKCNQMYKPLLCFLAQNHNRITTYYYGVKCAALHLYDNEHCYNLLSNNCAQVCVDILLNGIFADESKFYDLLFARFLVIPNVMYESLV